MLECRHRSADKLTSPRRNGALDLHQVISPRLLAGFDDGLSHFVQLDRSGRDDTPCCLQWNEPSDPQFGRLFDEPAKAVDLGNGRGKHNFVLRRGRIAAANAQIVQGGLLPDRPLTILGLRLGPPSVENGQTIAKPAPASRGPKSDEIPVLQVQHRSGLIRQVRQKIPVGHRHLSGWNRVGGRPIVMPLYRFCRL